MGGREKVNSRGWKSRGGKRHDEKERKEIL